jgi:hypothetical protein
MALCSGQRSLLLSSGSFLANKIDEITAEFASVALASTT